MTMKKILIASNYDDENFTEHFVNIPPMDEHSAQHICRELNDVDPRGPNYYRVVDPSHTPRIFQP